MTNEEAKEILEIAKAEVEWDCPIDYAVAFEMAIDALRAQAKYNIPQSPENGNGLKVKYKVFKADTGEIVDNCFVLRPDRDSAAVVAIQAYAAATDNKKLAFDLIKWIDALRVQIEPQ